MGNEYNGFDNEHAPLNGVSKSLASHLSPLKDLSLPAPQQAATEKQNAPAAYVVIGIEPADIDPVTMGLLVNDLASFDEICKHHPDYDADCIKKFRTFYEQNEDFTPEYIQGLLPKLAGEDTKRYDARIARAWKITPEKALLENLVAKAFSGQEPKITCDKNTDYWESLNDHCGIGNSALISTGFDVLRDVFLYHNGFNALCFDDSQARGATGYGVRIKHLSAPCIDNWGKDADEKYTWFRIYNQEPVQDPLQPFADNLGVRHTWTYYTKDCCIAYEAIATDKDQKPTASIVKVAWHSFGRPPIFGVECAKSAWLMRVIWDCLIALFSRRTAATCRFDDGAYEVFLLTLLDEPRPDGKAAMVVKDSQSGAMVLRINQQGQREDGKFVGPNPGEAELQLKDLEALGNALKELLTAVQFAAITQTQNPRATATGKMLDANPSLVIGYLFFLLWKAMLQEELDALAAYRGMNEEPRIEGVLTMAELMSSMMGGQPGQADEEQAPVSGAESGVTSSTANSAAASSSTETQAGSTISSAGSSAASTAASSSKSSGGSSSAAASSANAAAADKGPKITVKATLKKIDPARINPQHGTEEKFREDLKAKIKAEGFNPKYPVLVVEIPGMHADGGAVYKSLDGHHRAGASRELGLKSIPAYVIAYKDWQKLTDAFPFDPQKLGSMDNHIELPDGRLYSEVREDNSHTNGQDDASSAANSKGGKSK